MCAGVVVSEFRHRFGDGAADIHRAGLPTHIARARATFRQQFFNHRQDRIGGLFFAEVFEHDRA